MAIAWKTPWRGSSASCGIRTGPRSWRSGTFHRGRWPHRTTDRVIITRRQRQHYLDEHPEMAEFEEALIRTLLDPEQVHVATGPGDTAALFARRDSAHDIVVIVAVSSEESLANSVITARQQRATRKWSPANRLRMVWEK